MEALNPNPEKTQSPSVAERVGQLATHDAFLKDLFTTNGGGFDAAGYEQFKHDQHL